MLTKFEEYDLNLTLKLSIKRYIKLKQKLSCNECDFKSTQKSNLKLHKRSKHEGVTYPCDECDYKATQPGNLKQHKESIHLGVKFSCNVCDFKATH